MKVLINENNQIKKQINENKVEFEYGNSDNSNIKNPLKQNKKFWSQTWKKIRKSFTF